VADSYVFEIQNPAGDWTDVSDLVVADQMGAYSYAIEDSLLQFRTGDITLALHDKAGSVSALFAGADPTLTYRLRIARNGKKLFEGIIALPGQVTSSANEALVTITAFGYLALLDQVSAESVKRTFSALTLTADAAADQFQLTLPTTAGLTRDDRVRITSDPALAFAQDAEEAEISSVNSGTVVTLKTQLSNTWPIGSEVEVLTPYYRRKSIIYLVQQLFAAAGITNPTIDLTGADFAIPVGSPINTDGLPNQNPTGFLQVGSKIRLRMTNRLEYETTSAGDPFTVLSDGAQIGGSNADDPDGSFFVDWTKYELAEPSQKTIQWTQYKNGTGGSLDRADGEGVDHAHSPQPRKYVVRIAATTFQISYGDWTPFVRDIPAALVDLHTLETISGNQDNVIVSCEWDSANGRVWFAYGANNGSNGGRFGYYDVAGGTHTFLDSAASGTSTSSMGRLVYSRSADLLLRLKADGVTLQGWRGSLLRFEVTVPAGIRVPTMRYVNGRWVGILLRKDRSQILIADQYFTTITTLAFSDSGSSNQYPGQNWDFSNNLAAVGNQVFGYVDGRAVVIDTLYGGIVSYADFSGKTIAGALVELAKIVNAVAYVDNDFNGYFVSRNSQVFNATETKEIDGLIIDQEEDAVWEKWFGRVTVTANGQSITVGDASLTGDELSIEASYVDNLSVQSGLAYGYQQFYSRARRRRQLTIDDDETIYFPYQRVRIGAEEWAVYETNYSWAERSIEMRLVEAI